MAVIPTGCSEMNRINAEKLNSAAQLALAVRDQNLDLVKLVQEQLGDEVRMSVISAMAKAFKEQNSTLFASMSSAANLPYATILDACEVAVVVFNFDLRITAEKLIHYGEVQNALQLSPARFIDQVQEIIDDAGYISGAFALGEFKQSNPTPSDLETLAWLHQYADEDTLSGLACLWNGLSFKTLSDAFEVAAVLLFWGELPPRWRSIYH
jgi:hypothetical protein